MYNEAMFKLTTNLQVIPLILTFNKFIICLLSFNTIIKTRNLLNMEASKIKQIII